MPLTSEHQRQIDERARALNEAILTMDRQSGERGDLSFDNEAPPLPCVFPEVPLPSKPVVGFVPSGDQQRLLNAAVAQPETRTVAELCAFAGIDPSTYYRWCRDQPGFRAWFTRGWTEDFYFSAWHHINLARVQAPTKFAYWKAVGNLLFDPRGRAALEAWQEHVGPIPTPEEAALRPARHSPQGVNRSPQGIGGSPRQDNKGSDDETPPTPPTAPAPQARSAFRPVRRSLGVGGSPDSPSEAVAAPGCVGRPINPSRIANFLRRSLARLDSLAKKTPKQAADVVRQTLANKPLKLRNPRIQRPFFVPSTPSPKTTWFTPGFTFASVFSPPFSLLGGLVF